MIILARWIPVLHTDMKRRRGISTVELTLLLPILLGLFVCLIDMLFIVHNRTVLQADLHAAQTIAERHLAEATDDWLISADSDWKTGNSGDIAAARSIVDMFHLFLDKEALAKRITTELQAGNRTALYQIKQLSVDGEIHFFSMRYYLVYRAAIQSPFGGLTKHLFANYQEVSGRLRLDSNSHLQHLHDIELAVDQLETLNEIEALIKAVRGVLLNCLSKIN